MGRCRYVVSLAITLTLTEDIIDRGNGFEKKYFQSINSRKRVAAESYSWSVDDM